MLLEVLSEEAWYLITEKVQNTIRLCPDRNEVLSNNTLNSGLDWLFCAIDDEETPVASALFHSDFYEVVDETFSTISKPEMTVGQFFDACYEEYALHLTAFVDSIFSTAAVASGIANEEQTETAGVFTAEAEQLYSLYKRNCSERHQSGRTILGVDPITNFLQLLMYEYCRLKREKKVIKICANCDRIFIPQGRSDTKYCSYSAPQNHTKTCKEIGASEKHKQERSQDEKQKELYNEKQKYLMRDYRYRACDNTSKVEKNKEKLQNAVGKYGDYMELKKQSSSLKEEIIMIDYQITDRVLYSEKTEAVADCVANGKNIPVITITCGAVLATFLGVVAYAISKGNSPKINIRNIFSVEFGSSSV